MSSLVRFFLPRPLHPLAWWIWALGLLVAASRTTNPLLLGLIIAVAGLVVSARRSESPWSRAFSVFLVLGVIVVAMRLVFQAVFGIDAGGQLLVTLPEVTLPDWAAGMALGGPVTTEGLVAAFYDGLRLATMLICIGAANSLADPARLLKVVPGALYEVGVAVVVTFTVIPTAIVDIQRLRRARRLRGRPTRGLRGFAGVALPVVEGSLERAVELAAAMDSRGYGRSSGIDPRTRRVTGALTLAGVLGTAVGIYGLLDGTTRSVAGTDVVGWPLLVVGLGLAAVGLVVGGRRQIRSRYRPDPWSLPEWLVSTSGVVAAAALVAASAAGTAGLEPSTNPLAWPTLPWLPALAILLAALPAIAAPPVRGTSHDAAPAAMDAANLPRRQPVLR